MGKIINLTHHFFVVSITLGLLFIAFLVLLSLGPISLEDYVAIEAERKMTNVDGASVAGISNIAQSWRMDLDDYLEENNNYEFSQDSKQINLSINLTKEQLLDLNAYGKVTLPLGSLITTTESSDRNIYFAIELGSEWADSSGVQYSLLAQTGTNQINSKKYATSLFTQSDLNLEVLLSIPTDRIVNVLTEKDKDSEVLVADIDIHIEQVDAATYDLLTDSI